MRFSSTFAFSALMVLVSASTLARDAPSFSTKSACEKEDEDDCKDFCKLSEQSSTCTARENKITCYCKGGKAPDSNCEEKCLFCMPDKTALDEVNRLLKLGESKVEEL